MNHEIQEAWTPYLIWLGLFGEVVLVGCAALAPMNAISIPTASCVAGLVMAGWTMLNGQLWTEYHSRTRYMWEDIIRRRAYTGFGIVSMVPLAGYLGYEAIPWCLLAAAGAIAVQVIIIFAVLVGGIALREKGYY